MPDGISLFLNTMLKAIIISVTNDQLFVTKYVTLIAFVLLIIGATVYIFKFFRAGSGKEKLKKIIVAIVFVLLSLPVMRVFDIENNLLNNAKYINGTTTGYCNVFAKGEGVEFEYEVNGRIYINCNTFHPIPKDDIKVPDGKYYVRYSEKYPDIGRMNFNKPVR